MGLGKALGDGCIPWNQLDPVAIGPAGIPLKTDHTDLERMHPADLADIVEQLDHTAAGYVLSTWTPRPPPIRCKRWSEEMQGSLLEHLDTERAADILERMSPDEAADLLGRLARGPRCRGARPHGSGRGRGCARTAGLPGRERRRAYDHRLPGLAAHTAGRAALANIRAATPRWTTSIMSISPTPRSICWGCSRSRRCILAEPEATLAEVMESPVITVEPTPARKKSRRC